MRGLHFKFGTMNSSKTANLLMLAHSYKNQNKKILLVKPSIDTRYNKDIIFSRAFKEGIKADLIINEEDSKLSIDYSSLSTLSCILIDEAQFLSRNIILDLKNISTFVPVICYGLRTDYKGHLFEGSKALFELADDIEQIKSICSFCDNIAIINSKFYISKEGKKVFIYEGSDNVDLGNEDKYQAVCWSCWRK